MDIDFTTLHAASRFNEPILCDCGLDYYKGKVCRKTRHRHQTMALKLAQDQMEQRVADPPVVLEPINDDQNSVTIGGKVTFEGHCLLILHLEIEMSDADGNDAPMGTAFDNNSDQEQSEGDTDGNGLSDWSHIDTPLPSPPQSPAPSPGPGLPPHAANNDEYDGFVNVNHEDLEIYERWYTEESEQELQEIRGEMITDKDMLNIKMLAIRLCGRISRANYDRMRYVFKRELRLRTLWQVQTRLASLSGISPVVHDRCPDNHMAFTGDYTNDTHCRRCRKPRYNANGKAVAQWETLSLPDQLVAMFLDKDTAKLMSYRHNYESVPGLQEDIFDSQRYKELCQQNVVIDGVDTGRRFFQGEHDVALSLLGDGIQIFDHGHRASETCWPMIVQNLNLPPSERCKIKNVIPLTIIPGPQQPVDFNSFLQPFVEDARKLAGPGVKAYNAYTHRHFQLRAFPLIVVGDMQAIKHFSGMKGPNGKAPCRACRIVGVWDPGRKTYYIPLVRPFDPGAPPEHILSYDAHNLPLRTYKGLQRQARQIDSAPTQAAKDRLATDYGIAHPTLLDHIPSLQRPDSYPHEFMHLVLLNHGPNLVSLWIGKYDGITRPGSEDYLISAQHWTEIGRETAMSSRTIPSKFTRPLPNIVTECRLYNAESWSFWFQYIGPVVLRGRLPRKYFDHYMEFVWVLKKLLALSITLDEVRELRQRIIRYVEQFEEYYYQYNPDRLAACKLTLHALLHIADDVVRCGLVWASWSFLMEWYCAFAVDAALSLVNPYKSISNRIVEIAQLAALARQHRTVKRALKMGSGTPGDTSSMEHEYPEYPCTILRFPCLRQYCPDDPQRRRLAGYFSSQLGSMGTFNQWFSLLPRYCTRYGKVRVHNGGDYIRSTIAASSTSSVQWRDASFVRYVYWRDKYENQRHRRPEMEKKTEYGRLKCILVLELAPNPVLGIKRKVTKILADLTPCVCVGEDATIEPVTYRQFQPRRILDIQAVENVVGRVLSCGDWYIIDRSVDGARTTFVDDLDD